MAAEDGRIATAAWARAFATSLGPPKREPEKPSSHEWEDAFKMVAEKDQSYGWITALAEWANVSQRTVSRRWRNHDTSIHHVGCPPLLEKDDEDALVQRAIDEAMARNAVSPPEFRDALKAVATVTHTSISSGKCVTCGGSKGHLRGVKRRHPELRVRLAERTPSTRAVGMTRHLYAVCMDCLKRAGIERKSPYQVFNVDEANVYTVHGKVYVIAPGENIQKHLSARDAQLATHISIVVAVRANGLPFGKPIFIIAGTKVPESLAGDSDEYLLIHSPGGGQTAETWQQCAMYWASIAEGGEILVVDGHKSHLDFLAIEALTDKKISVVTLVPNASDIDQVCVYTLCCSCTTRPSISLILHSRTVSGSIVRGEDCR